MKEFIKTLCGCGGKKWVERTTQTIKQETEQDIYIADAIVEGRNVIALMVKGVVVDWVGRDYRDGVNEGASSVRLVKVLEHVREIHSERMLVMQGVYKEMMRLGMIALPSGNAEGTVASGANAHCGDEQVESARHIAFEKEADYE